MAPSWVNSLAMALPIPELAPVMMVILSWSFMVVAPFVRLGCFVPLLSSLYSFPGLLSWGFSDGDLEFGEPVFFVLFVPDSVDVVFPGWAVELPVVVFHPDEGVGVGFCEGLIGAFVHDGYDGDGGDFFEFDGFCVRSEGVYGFAEFDVHVCFFVFVVEVADEAVFGDGADDVGVGFFEFFADGGDEGEVAVIVWGGEFFAVYDAFGCLPWYF